MILSGVFPVLPTPFDDAGAVDAAGFDAVIDFAVSCGVAGCVYPGVASEVDTLGDDERAALVARLGRRLDGRVPFVVGASAAAPAEVLAHVAGGARAGAAAAMVMAPAAAGDPVGFFAEIGAQSPLPLMLQNAPAPIGAGLDADRVAEIARAVPNVRLVKEETLPCGQNLSRIRAACGDAIDGVFGGAGGRYVIDELARGALGTMPALEFADIHVRLLDAWAEGREDEARRLFAASLPALSFQAVFRMHMTKATLARRGVPVGPHVRGAGPRMDDMDRRELAALLDALEPELQGRPAAADAAE